MDTIGWRLAVTTSCDVCQKKSILSCGCASMLITSRGVRAAEVHRSNPTWYSAPSLASIFSLAPSDAILGHVDYTCCSRDCSIVDTVVQSAPSVAVFCLEMELDGRIAVDEALALPWEVDGQRNFELHCVIAADGPLDVCFMRSTSGHWRRLSKRESTWETMEVIPTYNDLAAKFKTARTRRGSQIFPRLLWYSARGSRPTRGTAHLELGKLPGTSGISDNQLGVRTRSMDVDLVGLLQQAKAALATCQRPVGFQSGANICFMNTALQTALACPMVAEALLSRGLELLSPEPSAVIPALIQMARALCAASSGSGGLSALSRSLSNHHLRAALSSTAENFNGTGQHDPMNVLDSLFLKTADPSDVTGFGPCPEDCSRLVYYYHRSTAAQKVRD
jgi:hypothetical protein